MKIFNRFRFWFIIWRANLKPKEVRLIKLAVVLGILDALILVFWNSLVPRPQALEHVLSDLTPTATATIMPYWYRVGDIEGLNVECVQGNYPCSSDLLGIYEGAYAQKAQLDGFPGAMVIQPTSGTATQFVIVSITPALLTPSPTIPVPACTPPPCDYGIYKCPLGEDCVGGCGVYCDVAPLGEPLFQVNVTGDFVDEYRGLNARYILTGPSLYNSDNIGFFLPYCGYKPDRYCNRIAKSVNIFEVRYVTDFPQNKGWWGLSAMGWIPLYLERNGGEAYTDFDPIWWAGQQ